MIQQAASVKDGVSDKQWTINQQNQEQITTVGISHFGDSQTDLLQSIVVILPL